MADIILIMPLANRFDKVSIRMPNGLLAIASLPFKQGYSVKIIDLKLDAEWQQTLKKSIDSHTLCVGITCSTGRMISNALEIASYIRGVDPRLPIVWGGPHPTLLPEQTLKNDLVDIIVMNEGEKVFMELVDALAHKKSISGIAGIGYKAEGSIRINHPASLLNDLDSLPPYPYELIDVSRYSAINKDGLPSLDIVTSRGCPFNCGFCSIPATSQHSWRSLSVKKVIENIKFLKETYGIKSFYFVDDNFMVDLKRIEHILDSLKENNLSIYWGTQGVRIDTINRMSDRFLDKIEKSGCIELSIGVESANPDILNEINKGFDVKDVYAANKKLKGRCFAVKYNMIIGFPGETIAGIKKTVELAIELYKNNKKAWFPFNIFTPFPGTPIFQKAIKSGFNPPGTLEDWAHLEPTGWSKHYHHWMTEKENELLESINCTSYLAFSSGLQRSSQRLVRAILKMYQPFAYFRFAHMFYYLHFEKALIQGMD